MFKKIKEEFFTIFGFSVLIFMFGFIGYKLWYDNYLTMFIHMMIFIMFIVHYLCTMGNQSVFYSYFQSWEWKACWEDNDIKRIAGEQQSIIKKSLIMQLSLSLIKRLSIPNETLKPITKIRPISIP